MLFGQLQRESARDSFDLRSFNELQIQEMQRHKWIESEKAGRDLGVEAELDWIQRYAVSFREAYGSSPALTQADRARMS